MFLCMPVMENLTHAAGDVTVLLHPPRQRGHFRPQLTKMLAIDIKPQSSWPQSSKHGSTGWIAHGLLAVGTLEQHPAPCQCIQMWRDRHRAVTTQFRPEVVCHNKQDICSARDSVRWQGGEQQQHSKGGKTGNHSRVITPGRPQFCRSLVKLSSAGAGCGSSCCATRHGGSVPSR